MQDEVDALTATVEIDPNALRERLRAGLGELTDVVRGQGDGSGLLSVIATPEQRTILDRVSAFMSVVEGHAEFVMNAVSSDVIPSQPTIEERFGVRRRRGGNPLDRLLRRLLGLEAKTRQYIDGAAFVRAVVNKAGVDGFNTDLDVARDPAHEGRDRVARRLDRPRPFRDNAPISFVTMRPFTVVILDLLPRSDNIPKIIRAGRLHSSMTRIAQPGPADGTASGRGRSPPSCANRPGRRRDARCSWRAPVARTRWLSPRRRSSRLGARTCRPASSPSTTRCRPGSLEQARAVASIGFELGYDPVGSRSRRRGNGWWSGGGSARGALRGSRRGRRGLRCGRAARAHPRRPGRDGSARSRPGLRPAQRGRDATGRRALPSVPSSGSAGRRRRRRARLSASCRGTTRPTATRASSACGCAPRCCRSSSRSCRAGWRRPWPVPRPSPQSDLDALDAIAESYLPAEGARRLTRRAWPRTPQAIRSRVLRRWATARRRARAHRDPSRRAGCAGRALARASSGRSARRVRCDSSIWQAVPDLAALP